MSSYHQLYYNVVSTYTLIVLLHHGDFVITGLHFNISEGRPISNSSSIQSLVDDNGCFLGKLGTKTSAEKGKIELDHVC